MELHFGDDCSLGLICSTPLSLVQVPLGASDMRNRMHSFSNFILRRDSFVLFDGNGLIFGFPVEV